MIAPDKYIEQLENAIKDPPLWVKVLTQKFENGFIHGVAYAMSLYQKEEQDDRERSNSTSNSSS